MAIRDNGGLEVLINLLDTAEVKCKVEQFSIKPTRWNSFDLIILIKLLIDDFDY